MQLQILSVDYRSDITDLKMRLGDQNYMRCKMLHEKRGEEGREERREGNVRGWERERDKGEERRVKMKMQMREHDEEVFVTYLNRGSAGKLGHDGE